ncbi:MAG: SH3 domain-containing protein [Spirochaetota bacterium]
MKIMQHFRNNKLATTYKKLILILLTFLSISCNSEKDYFTTGKIVYVVEKQGLNLREKPGTKYSKIAYLPFMSRVKVFKHSKEKETLYAKTAYWYKVELQNSSTGWVFGAFVDSEFKSLLSKDIPVPKDNCKSLENYSESHFQRDHIDKNKVFSGYGDERDASSYVENYKIFYSNGASYSSRYQAKENEYYELILPNANVLDGYIVLKFCQKAYRNSFATVAWNDASSLFYRKTDGELWEYTIRKYRNGIKISIHTAL